MEFSLLVAGVRFDVDESTAEAALRVMMATGGTGAAGLFQFSDRKRTVLVRSQDIVGRDGPNEAMRNLRSRLGF